MDYVKSVSAESYFSQLSSILAKVSFFMYLFFVFFGTSLPFQYEASSVEDIATSNPINQFLFSSLYLLSLFGLLSKRHRIFKFLKTEKFFSFFLLWTFFTVFWSDFPFVSFKRWLQLFGTGIVLLSALLHFESVDEALGYLKAILTLYIPLTFLSILMGPGVDQLGWKGLTMQKNILGQHALLSLIIWSIAFVSDSGIKKRGYALVFWCVSFILLIGSRSVTCILTAMILFLVFGPAKAQKAVFEPVIGRLFSLMFIFLFWFSIAAILIFIPDLLASVFASFGKDMTLTGRLELWDTIFSHTKNYLFSGCGFGGFWVIGSAPIDMIYEQYTWLPNRSHLGYLDILNETGIIGLFLFGLMVIYYISNLLKLEKKHFWKWFFIVALILNITETTLTFPNTAITVLFIFSYLALYIEHCEISEGHRPESYTFRTLKM